MTEKVSADIFTTEAWKDVVFPLVRQRRWSDKEEELISLFSCSDLNFLKITKKHIAATTMVNQNKESICV